MNACLQFRSIEKRYGRVTALAGVDLDIEEGSVVALLGPNGAGKSTLFGCLLGLTHATAGEVRWRGNPVTTANRLRFGYTPERVALYPHRSVWENGVFFARLRGHHPAEFEAQLTRMGLENFRERRICQLSKGMLQRLSLA